MHRRWASVVVVGLVACVGACNDSESVGDALEQDDDSDPDGATTTTGGEQEEDGGERVHPEDVDVRVPSTGHRYATSAPYDVSGVVEDPDHYTTTGTLGDLVTEVIVVDREVFIRNGTVESINTERYDTVSIDQYAARGPLEQLDELSDDGDEVLPDDVANATFNLASELATSDPAAFVEVLLASDRVEAETDGEETSISTPRFVPPLAAELYDDVDGVAPIGAEVVVGADGVPIASVLRADLGTPVRLEFTYEFEAVDPVVAPPPELLDLTPDIDEEELAAFADTPLVAPATPPPGMALRSVLILSATETVEGCPQVQLEYADDAIVDALVIFLLPQTCAEAFDPTPFAETFGGLPSRSDGAEVLHGTTVVQLTGTLRQPEFEEVAASLQPTTPDALIAAVVPLPD